ncbi:EAL domain-containing protein [Vibrio cholerae]
MIFAPAFQPIKDVGTGLFVAAEVLARWYDEGRVLTPSSLSSPPYWGLVDMEAARFILDNLHHCQDQYPTLFLNVSEQTLHSGVIFKAWARVIQAIAKSRSLRLVIEITEGIKDASLASRWDALTEIGVELALDDYGDKNSSLERLSRYDWHYCKFDARRLCSLEDYPAILHCRRKGIQLIAEQVESFPLGERAKLLGLSWQQGFYHGKPAVMEKHLNYVKALP